MPRRPNNSSFTLTIDEDFDETKSYRVKLFELEERESSFAGAKPGAMTDIWKLNIYRDDGTAFENTSSGEVFECWAWTTDSTFANPTTGQRSKGRAYAEAFMGRELSDDEINELIDQGFAEALEGKTALGSFEITTTADGNQRLSVVKLRPLKKDAEPVRQAAASPRNAASRSQQRRLDE